MGTADETAGARGTFGAGLRTWTPAQVTVAALGIAWTVDGVLAFLGDPSTADLGRRFEVGLLGTSIAVDGWHALFHLVTGAVALAACAQPRAARAYAIVVGAVYLLAALSGLVTGGSALAILYVDALGSAVHMLEGGLALAAGVVSLRPRSPGEAVA